MTDMIGEDGMPQELLESMGVLQSQPEDTVVTVEFPKEEVTEDES